MKFNKNNPRIRHLSNLYILRVRLLATEARLKDLAFQLKQTTDWLDDQIPKVFQTRKAKAPGVKK
jgi:hypothetical protein